MRILFVSAVLPWPIHSGGQIRIYHLLKRLVKNHEITLVSFIRSENERNFTKELSFCKDVHLVLRGSAWQAKYLIKSFGRYPFLLATYDNLVMKNELQKILQETDFDGIHIEPFYVWPSLPKTNLPLVVGEHNIEYEVYEKYAHRFSFAPIRPFLFLDVIKLRFWETLVWKKANAVTCVSQHDEYIVKKVNGSAYRVTNGVDLGAFPFRPKKKLGYKFLYVGNFKWMENRDAAQYLRSDIWPLIKKKFPQAELRIVGKGAPDGEVKNISREFQKADILLAPIRVGGGTKFKILEAMATGLPVITTNIGAEGLDKSVLWIAHTPFEFVEQIHDCMENREKVKNARELIEREYNWNSIADNLSDVWTSL